MFYHEQHLCLYALVSAYNLFLFLLNYILYYYICKGSMGGDERDVPPRYMDLINAL